MCQILGLIDNTTGRKKTYLLRFWEKKFKQAKCSVIYNGRRYYSDDNIKVLNIGERQKGRTRFGEVLDSKGSRNNIKKS